MAITLPDFTALPQLTPQASNFLPQYPATDPGAAAEAKLGEGVEKLGQAATSVGFYADIGKTKMDRAMADADFTNRIIPITEKLKVETDPEQITALKEQYREALNLSSQAIGDPQARAFWQAQASKHVAVGEAAADLRNSAIYNDKYTAGALAKLADLARNGAGATDPAAFEAAKGDIDATLAEGVKSGAFSSTAAQERGAKVKADLVAGRIASLDARGQSDEARALLNANRDFLGPVMAGHLDATIASTGERRRDQDEKKQGQDYERWLNGEGPRPAAPGARGRVGGGATGLVPYTPSSDILSGTGLTADQYQTYRSHLASRESGSYGIVNAGGYAGRYQMGPNEIKETATRLGVPVPSQQEFLSNPDLQEKFLENYTLDHHNSLMQQSEQYRNASPAEKAGILMGAHLGGVGGVQTYLTGKGDPADANGTRVSSYVGSMKQAMAGPPAPGAATTATAAPAPAAAQAPSPGMLGQGNLDPATLPGGRPAAQNAVPVEITDGPLKGKFVLLPRTPAPKQGEAASSAATAEYNEKFKQWQEANPTSDPKIFTDYRKKIGLYVPPTGETAALLTPDEATDQYEKDGKHLGVFDNAQAATAHAQRLAGAPAGGAPAATVAAPSGAIEVWGDSLGVGLKGRLKAPGTAVGGAKPTAIFNSIKEQPDSYWQGKTVVLPSGSNGNEMGVVEDTIKYLQDEKRGARVIAVGYGPKFPEKNAQLREIAGRLNVPVIDAEDVGSDGVHPGGRGYQSMAAKIRAAQPLPSRGSSTAAVAPPGAGTDENVPTEGGDYGGGGDTAAATPATPAPGGSGASTVRSPDIIPPTATPAPTTAGTSDAAPTTAPDWATLAQRIRDSDLPPGAKTAAFQKLEERKRMFEFGKQDVLPKYNAQVHAAVEQRIDDIVQGAARSDDPEVRRKAEGDLATIVKWGVDTGAVPANKGYEAERAAKTQLITGRAQYLDASGKSDEALALIQQNKDTLPPQIYQAQVDSLRPRAETQQGTRFERQLQIGGGPGYAPGAPTPGMLPGGPADFPTPLAPSPFQQKLQAIADSNLPDGAKKAAHAAAISRHELEVVGQDRAKSDLELAVRKGEAGRLDIEQAYRDGRIAPAARTEMHGEIDKIEANRNAEAGALAKVNNAANGGAPLDPKSEYDKKALNYHFDKVSAGWPANEASQRSIDYAVKYGLIPDRLKGMIRGSLHSGSSADMVAAAGTINQIRNRNPQLVGEIGDENDLRLATLLQTYTDAGVRPDRAVELATSGMKVGKPERDARADAFDEERGKTKVDQHTSDTNWLTSQLNSIWRRDPDVDPTMRKEFEEVSKAEYQRTGSLEASRRMALDNINNLWGRTRVGGDLRYMKHAPEKYYGVPGLSDSENASWMNEQLLADTRKDSLQDATSPIASERLHLVPAPDRTAPDGRPAYQVWLEHPTTKQWELVTRPDGQARVWAPDWTSSDEKGRRDAAQSGDIDLMRQQRSGGTVGIPLATPGLF